MAPVNATNLTPVAALVYTPVNSGSLVNNVKLVNTSAAPTSPLFFGTSGLTQANGTALQAGQNVKLVNCTAAVYCCAGYQTTATTTTSAAAYTAGTTQVVLSSGTGFAAATYIMIGTGTAAEVASASVNNTTVTTSALLLDHKSGATVTNVTPQVAQVAVTAGVQQFI